MPTLDYCFAIRYFNQQHFEHCYSFLTKLNRPTYLLQGTLADEFLEEIITLPHRYVVCVDEDAFLFDKKAFLDLLRYLDGNGIDVCGMRDGGVIPRTEHPLVINPFFLVLNIKKIRTFFNKKDIDRNPDIKKYNHLLTPQIIQTLLPGRYNLSNNAEPYYPFFFYLLEHQCTFHYLDYHVWEQDSGVMWDGEQVKIATILKNSNHNGFLMHCWLSSYLNPHSRESRFTILSKHAKTLEKPSRALRDTSLYMYFHQKLFTRFYYRMIIIKLSNNFGEQLFQYAFARNLTVRNGMKLKLFFANGDNPNLVPICRLTIIKNEASDGDVFEITKRNGKNYFEIKWNACKELFAPYYSKTLVKESKQQVYDENLLQINTSCCIEGAFKNELYFAEIKELLIKDFDCNEILPDNVHNYLDKINKTDSVCLNIYTNTQHDFKYYKKAITYISTKLNDAVFYIFTDDIPWVQTQITLEQAHEFALVKDDDILLFRIMRSCKHHILGNTEISWWAAWLAEQSDSIIVAPQNNYSVAVVPERWTKV